MRAAELGSRAADLRRRAHVADGGLGRRRGWAPLSQVLRLGIRIRCRVRVVVPVGEQRPEGPLTLACASSSTATPCGPELSCDSASQICVRREHGGPGVFYACEAVPSGCESDRSCGCVRASLCPFDTCQDEGPNSISCVCEGCV